jgi:Domain of unknown function (DUF3127)
MEVQGTLSALLPVVTGTGKNGNWKKQEFILDIPGNFPKKVCISTWGDRIDMNSFGIGETIKAFIDIESREYNGRWYTDVRAWKVERAVADANAPMSVSSNDEAPPVMAMADLPDDDLPF